MIRLSKKKGENHSQKRLLNKEMKASVVDSLCFFVASLKNGFLVSVVISAKEHMKSLNKEAKVENKSCERLF